MEDKAEFPDGERAIMPRAREFGYLVMPGLVPGIHVLLHLSKKDVDGRDEARP